MSGYKFESLRSTIIILKLEIIVFFRRCAKTLLVVPYTLVLPPQVVLHCIVTRFCKGNMSNEQRNTDLRETYYLGQGI
jgi:hypothetical protein